MAGAVITALLCYLLPLKLNRPIPIRFLGFGIHDEFPLSADDWGFGDDPDDDNCWDVLADDAIDLGDAPNWQIRVKSGDSSISWNL